MLFLSCLLASGTLSLEAEAKFTLHLKEVCWLKVGGFGGGGQEAGSSTFPTQHAGSSEALETAELAARLLSLQRSHTPIPTQNSTCQRSSGCGSQASSLEACSFTGKTQSSLPYWPLC